MDSGEFLVSSLQTKWRVLSPLTYLLTHSFSSSQDSLSELNIHFSHASLLLSIPLSAASISYEFVVFKQMLQSALSFNVSNFPTSFFLIFLYLSKKNVEK